MLVNEFRLKLYVKNFDGMARFYEETLGFEPVDSWDNGPDDRGVLLDTGSGIVEIISAGSLYAPVQGCDVSLEVDDVWGLWEELQGLPVIHALRQNRWGDSSFCIRDPEGLRLTFFSPDRDHELN
ncbi:MAG TPA: VOC family protein [Planktothrix sp.]|jgi:catechol 2,3-dioxygenase-like lactoylglutathione lyase family enzyme